MSEPIRRLLLIAVAIALPIVVSQVLPQNVPEPGLPVVPVLLLIALGGLAGWLAPSIRAWAITALWVVAGAALVLLSWTDLVLDVAPSIATVGVWRAEAFVAIVGAVVAVSAGFAVGAMARRRGSPGTPDARAAGWVVAGATLCLVVAGLTATVFAASQLVLQDDVARLTVIVTDHGVEVTPATMDGTDYRVVYESRASRPKTLAVVAPLGVSDGRARAMTGAEIETWLAGDWAALEPPFQSAVASFSIDPGERFYGGPLQLAPSPDGTGGALWYAAEADAYRPWPGAAFDGEGPVPAPWPVEGHVVVPVQGS